MKINFKKFLLTGTAVVAVSVCASQANAAALTLGANGTWASAGTHTSAPTTDVTSASAGDTVAISGATTLTVTNDGVSNDGSGNTNTFSLGAVTNPAGNGVLTVTTGAGAAAMTATIASATLTSNANFLVTNVANDKLTAGVTGLLSVGGNLAITNAQATTAAMADGVTVGSVTVTGTTGITAGGLAGGGETASLTVTGTSSFNGAVTLTGGAAAASNTASLVLNGASNTFTGGLVLTNGAVGHANLTLSGAVAQTVTGNITGTGDIVAANSSTGVTFAGTVATGSVKLDSGAGTSSNATFMNTVNSTTGFVVGNAGGVATNTLTFDATTQSFTATGAITGNIAGETNNVVIAGGAGKTVTLASAVGAGNNIDNITVNANTTLNASGALTATTGLVLGASATVNAAANITAPITLGGGATLATTGADTFTGDINGAGTLAIANNSTVVGGIGNTTPLTAVTVATGTTLTLDATAANRTLNATTTTLTGTGVLALTNGANTIGITNAITTTGASAITTSGGAGTITFGGDVGTLANPVSTLTPTDNATTSAINANGNLYITTITLGQNDTLNLLGTTGTVSGAINGAGAGKGAVVVGNGVAASNYTFGAGALGATRLAGFQVAVASTATVKNDVSTTSSGVGVAGFDNEGTLNVDASGNTVTLSTLTGKTVFNGTTTITGAQNVTATAATGLTVDGTLSTILSGANKTLTLTGTGGNSIGTNTSTTITAGNQIVLGAATTLGSNGHVTTVNVQKTAAFDPTATTVIAGGANAVTVAAGTGTLVVNIAGASLPLVNGDAITVISSTGGSNFGTLIGNGTIALQNTGLVKLTDNASDASSLKVKAVFSNPANVLSTSANATVATTLMNFPGATGNLATARVNLLTAPTAAAANLVAESLSPPADGAAAAASIDVSGRVFNLNSQRLASLRQGDTSSGVATGNSSQAQRGWGEAFGRKINQNNRSGTAGYDANTGGVAFGADGETNNGGHLGLSVGYGRTAIDSDNANRTRTDIDSYQVGLYGDMPIADKTFLNGMVGYVFNQNQTTRHNVGGISGLTASGDFNANQLNAELEVGRDFEQSGGLTLTPTALVNYTYYKPSSYTETGAGTANLNVAGHSLSALNLGVGLDAAWMIQQADGSKLRPSLSAGYRYDVIGDSMDSTASFTGGGGAFTTTGVTPSRGTANVGAGLKYFTTSNWELSAQYNYDAKSGYGAHTAQIRAGYKF